MVIEAKRERSTERERERERERVEEAAMLSFIYWFVLVFFRVIMTRAFLNF